VHDGARAGQDTEAGAILVLLVLLVLLDDPEPQLVVHQERPRRHDPGAARQPGLQPHELSEERFDGGVRLRQQQRQTAGHAGRVRRLNVLALYVDDPTPQDERFYATWIARHSFYAAINVLA
jgi:hypothetical protein